eukprot:tig00000180_g13641.t1
MPPAWYGGASGVPQTIGLEQPTELDLSRSPPDRNALLRLAEDLARNGPLQSLRLARGSCDPEIGKRLGAALSANRNVKLLDLSGAFGMPELQAKQPDAGPDGRPIENEFYVKLHEQPNLLYDKPVLEFARGMQMNSTLQVLDLSSNCICFTAASALADVLRNNRSITSLNLSSSFGLRDWKQGGHKSELALAESEWLAMDREEYDGPAPIHDEETRVIADALRTNTTLTILDMSYNFIGAKGPSGTRALAEMLRANQAINALMLRGNAFGRKAVRAVVDALRTNTACVKLDLIPPNPRTAGRGYGGPGATGAIAPPPAGPRGATLEGLAWELEALLQLHAVLRDVRRGARLSSEGMVRFLQDVADVGFPGALPALVSMKAGVMDLDGNPLLHLAVRTGSLELVRGLADLGCVLSREDAATDTALDVAIRMGHGEIASFLIDRLDHESLCHANERTGQSPLHYAAKAGHPAIVQKLVARNAEVNAQDLQGNTPLHSAVQFRQNHVVKLLLDAGASVTSPARPRASFGRSALPPVEEQRLEEEAALAAERLEREREQLRLAREQAAARDANKESFRCTRAGAGPEGPGPTPAQQVRAGRARRGGVQRALAGAGPGAVAEGLGPALKPVGEAVVVAPAHPPELRDFAVRLRDALLARKVPCWLDEVREPRGREKADVEQRIKSARGMVFVVSGPSLRSAACRRDLEIALIRDIPVFFALREQVPPPDAETKALLSSSLCYGFTPLDDPSFHQRATDLAAKLAASMATGLAPAPIHHPHGPASGQLVDPEPLELRGARSPRPEQQLQQPGFRGFFTGLFGGGDSSEDEEEERRRGGARSGFASPISALSDRDRADRALEERYRERERERREAASALADRRLRDAGRRSLRGDEETGSRYGDRDRDFDTRSRREVRESARARACGRACGRASGAGRWRRDQRERARRGGPGSTFERALLEHVIRLELRLAELQEGRRSAGRLRPRSRGRIPDDYTEDVFSDEYSDEEARPAPPRPAPPPGAPSSAAPADAAAPAARPLPRAPRRAGRA